MITMKTKKQRYKKCVIKRKLKFKGFKHCLKQLNLEIR